jgi:hypothetical protein
LPEGAMAVLPLLGATVRGTAALVVTSDAKDANGIRLGPSDDLKKLMACEDVADAAVVVDCAPYKKLKEDLGFDENDVALMQVYTVRDATALLSKAADVIRNEPPPRIEVLEFLADADEYRAYEGEVDLLQFQKGSPPFGTFDDEVGGFVLDESGIPIPQRIETVRFALTVPRQPQPDGGFPVVVYGHGTGGDLHTALGNDSRWEAHQLATAGWAMLATSEPLHLDRRGYSAGTEAVVMFNFLNPVAGRCNWLQSALEKMQLVRAVQNLGVNWSISQAPTGYDFNDDMVAYLGHSQGGIVGALVAGVEDEVRGMFLSGAGAGFAASLSEKTEPVEVAGVLRTLFVMPEGEVIDRFHPVPNLLQLGADEADPLNYGRAWRKRDATKRTPHIVMTSGLLDPYTPKRTQGALSASFGLPLVDPIAEQVEVMDLLGIEAAGVEAQGNLVATDGRPLTAASMQYPEDGHFAIYFNPDAKGAYQRFFETLLDGVPVARSE